MNQKIAIVTGANSGMGLATSAALARKGIKVIMACRNRERGEAALSEARSRAGNGANLELMLCDLGSIASIRAFAAAYTAKYPALDILVNNAGVVAIKRQLTEDGFELDFGVNHLGHFLLTLLLLDRLKAAEQGRIVVVASGAYKIGSMHYGDPTLSKGFNPAKAYGRSKLANILFARELAKRLRDSRVTVNSLHPGAVGTNLGVNRDTGFGRTVMKLLSHVFLTPEQGADTAVYLATAPGLAGTTGQYFYRRKVKPLSARASSPEEAERLWAFSLRQVGLSED